MSIYLQPDIESVTLGLEMCQYLTRVAHLFRMRSGDVGNTPKSWLLPCGHLL